MIAEVLSIGTELLLGQIVNTDAAYIAGRLSEAGVTLHHQTTVGDNPDRLREAMALSLSRADVVITTGGLGPTADDITKELAASALGLPMERNPEAEAQVCAWFAKSGHAMTPNNLRQADFAKGAIILRNDYGTAPGCIVERDGKAVIHLPGPPRELFPMFDAHVMPYLEARSGARIVSRYLRLYGIGESAVEDRLSGLMAGAQNPTIAPYCSTGEVQLRLTMRCTGKQDATPHLDSLEARVRQQVGEYIYAVTDNPRYGMEEAVVSALADARKTVAIAESCTGGMIASRIVGVPGASAVLSEAYVTYADEAKARILGVSRDTLALHGAVSEQTALEMAKGLRARSSADVCLAVTGIAGPGGGSEQKPVGLVWFAVCTAGGAFAKERRFTGDRSRVQTLAALYGLDLIRRGVSAL